MVDLNKLNPESAQEIIKALKDGKINAKEAKKLGLTAKEAEELNRAFSSGAASIGDFVLINKGKSKDGKFQYSKTEKAEPKDKFSNKDIRYDMKSGRFVVYHRDLTTGKETFKYYEKDGKQLREDSFKAKEKLNDKFVQVNDKGQLSFKAKQRDFFQFTDEKGKFSFAETLGTVARTVLSPLMLFTSCSPAGEDDINIDMNQKVDVEVVNKNDTLEAALDKILTSLNSLEDKTDEQTKYLNSILETLKTIVQKEIANGATLDEIKTLIGDNTQLLEIIIEAMTKNNDLLTEIKDGMGSNNEKILEVLVGIQQTVNTLASMVANLPDYADQLNNILNAIKKGNCALDTLLDMVKLLLQEVAENGDTQKDILAKLDEIEASKKSDSEKFAAMLELLKSIDTTTKDIDSKLDTIISDLEAHFKNDDEVKKYLKQILSEVKKNNSKTDVTNELLTKIYNMIEKLGTTADELGKKILAYIAKIGSDLNEQLAAILEAINKGAEGSDGVRALLEKILAGQDSNTQKIIEAMGNMMSRFEEEFGKNDDRYNNIINILNKINAKIGEGDNAELLDKLDKIIAKLDDILAAIKDHKVTVDVTGKVTCECNCGDSSKHEGIIGDLEDILN